MSKIKLAPNASGTGTFTILAPNSNTNRTYSLPDDDGTVLLSDATPFELLESNFASTAEVSGVGKTASCSANSTTLTIGSSGGISNGDTVVGAGIISGTTVSSGAGTTTLTLSAATEAALNADPVRFYKTTKALSPGNVAGGLCRAWVNFNGQDNNIRAAYNVSSITDLGTGWYEINFTTDMPDANYAMAGIAGVRSSQTDAFITLQGDSLPTASSVKVQTRETTGADRYDYQYVTVIIFR